MNRQEHCEVHVAMEQSVRELAEGQKRMTETVDAYMRERKKADEGLLQALADVRDDTKSLTNGGLSRALEAALPTLIQSVVTHHTETQKAQIEADAGSASARWSFRQTVVPALIGAAATLLGMVLKGGGAP